MSVLCRVLEDHSFQVSCQMGNSFSDESAPLQRTPMQQNPYAHMPQMAVPTMPVQNPYATCPPATWQGGQVVNRTSQIPAPMPRRAAQKPVIPQGRMKQSNPRPVSNQIVNHAAKEKLNFNNVVDKIDQYEQTDQKLENLIKRLRQKRFEAFQKELHDFESRHDPFHLLGLEPTDDVDVIKRAYRRLSLKHHPDKGGSEETFAALTKAYCYLLKKMDKLKYRPAQPHELKEQVAECMKQQPATLGENRFVDRTKFGQFQ